MQTNEIDVGGAVRKISNITLIITLVGWILSLPVPITNLVIGFTYLNDCSIDPLIPKWLIIQGIAWLVFATSVLVLMLVSIRFGNIVSVDLIKGNFKTISSTSSMVRTLVIIILIFFISIFVLFLIAWFIAGNVWVYSKYTKWQSSNKESTNDYCNDILYYYSFWLITIIYITCGIIILWPCYRCICG